MEFQSISFLKHDEMLNNLIKKEIQTILRAIFIGILELNYNKSLNFNVVSLDGHFGSANSMSFLFNSERGKTIFPLT